MSPNATLESRVAVEKDANGTALSFLAFPSRFVDDDDDDDDEVLRRQTVTLRRRRRRPRRRRRRRRLRGDVVCDDDDQRPPLVVFERRARSGRSCCVGTLRRVGGKTGSRFRRRVLDCSADDDFCGRYEKRSASSSSSVFGTTRSSFIECTRDLNRGAERGVLWRRLVC